MEELKERNFDGVIKFCFSKKRAKFTKTPKINYKNFMKFTPQKRL
ncbi:hypothetical protein QM027_02910 [Campylobacter concisus]